MDFTIKPIAEQKSGNDMAASFGVTEERYTEVLEEAVKLYEEGKTLISDIVIQMSAKCKHQNELAMFCFGFGAFVQQSRMLTHAIKLHVKKS